MRGLTIVPKDDAVLEKLNLEEKAAAVLRIVWKAHGHPLRPAARQLLQLTWPVYDSTSLQIQGTLVRGTRKHLNPSI